MQFPMILLIATQNEFVGQLCQHFHNFETKYAASDAKDSMYYSYLSSLSNNYNICLNKMLKTELQYLAYAQMAYSNELSDYIPLTTMLGDSSHNQRLCGYISYNSSVDEVIIGIKGTTDWRDSKINLDCFGETHEGFAQYASVIFKQVYAFIQNHQITDNTKYVIVGHSLGAAAAYFLVNMLCYWQLVSAENIILRTYALPKNIMGNESILQELYVMHLHTDASYTISNRVEKSNSINVIHYGYAEDPVMNIGHCKNVRNLILKKEVQKISPHESIFDRFMHRYCPHFLELFPRLIVSVYSDTFTDVQTFSTQEYNTKRSRYLVPNLQFLSDIFRRKTGTVDVPNCANHCSYSLIPVRS